MPQWKWTIYQSNELDKLLYEYLKSCSRMKDNIIQAIEAFYLPYALKHIGASPLEVQKAYQRSIDILQSRVRIMKLDAGVPIGTDDDITVVARRQVFDNQLPPIQNPIQITQDDPPANEIENEPPIQPRKRIMDLEDLED
jgi:hypothetical protein